MAAIVLDLDDNAYEALKRRAERNQRTLEAEVHAVLALSVRDELREEFVRWTAALREEMRPDYTGNVAAEIPAERNSR